MGIANVLSTQTGKEVCLMGNEAFARGAIEAGVNFVSSYPGSPSSEISGTLFKVAKTFDIYGEWSVNEKVGLEAAGAASLSGLRAMSVMKHNGLNVCLDFLLPFAQQGCVGGFVVIVCDDPSTHSSTNETDSRFLARMGEIPMLEPGNFQEAKDCVKYAFELSEALKIPVMVRGVTRLSHARGNVVLGEVPPKKAQASIADDAKFITDKTHYKIKEKAIQAQKLFEESPLNRYDGPAGCKNLIIACGVGHLYAMEAVSRFGLEGNVGVLKLVTGWPVPKNLVLRHLQDAETVLFVEEIEAYMEEQVKALVAQSLGRCVMFHGKADGAMASPQGPGLGELTPDDVFKAVGSVFVGKEPAAPVVLETNLPLPRRELTFCAGCPHRASYWSLERALRQDGRGGFAMGDIGCYGLEALMEGQTFMKTLHCMGGGMGMGNGFGQMRRFGMDKPVVPVVGDSTFFHSVLPGLINARYNGARLTLLVLDNDATAMTGFQPHPGTGMTALREPAVRIGIEDACKGVGVHVYTADAYDIKASQAALKEALADDEVNVVVLRRICALIAFRSAKKPKVTVDKSKCLGEKCGICSRRFKCPGNIWDRENGCAAIDDVLCVGCGVCAAVCPRGAIQVEGGALQ